MEKILSDLLELISLDAISFDERKIADAVKAKLAQLGADELYEDDAGEKIGGNTGNIFARFKGTLPGAVMFSAHMDRMPKGFGIQPVISGHNANGRQMTVTGQELKDIEGFVPEKVTSQGDTILAADDLTGVSAIIDGIRRLKESGQVTVTATPRDGCQFAGWSRYKGSGRFPSAIEERVHTFEVTGDVRFVAGFVSMGAINP